MKDLIEELLSTKEDDHGSLLILSGNLNFNMKKLVVGHVLQHNITDSATTLSFFKCHKLRNDAVMPQQMRGKGDWERV